MKHELDKVLVDIEKWVGVRWLHEQVHDIRDTDPRHSIGAKTGCKKIHPLAQAWFDAREEFILSDISRATTFSEKTCRLAELGKDIFFVSSSPGFQAQKNRLLDQNLYWPAAYEMTIAAGYARSGAGCSFTCPGIEIRPKAGLIKAICYVVEAGSGDAGAGLVHALEREMSYPCVHEGPSLVYLDVPSKKFADLANNVQWIQQIENLIFAHMACNALVITGEKSPGWISNEHEGLLRLNPEPRDRLPDGFRIYTPGAPSSRS